MAEGAQPPVLDDTGIERVKELEEKFTKLFPIIADEDTCASGTGHDVCCHGESFHAYKFCRDAATTCRQSCGIVCIWCCIAPCCGIWDCLRCMFCMCVDMNKSPVYSNSCLAVCRDTCGNTCAGCLDLWVSCCKMVCCPSLACYYECCSARECGMEICGCDDN